MSTEKSERRIVAFLTEGPQRKPVKIRPSCKFSRARTDQPFYFSWLPHELVSRILSPDNFVDVPGAFTMPPSCTTLMQRKEVFRYIDDLLALRLVNRCFAYKFKRDACIHSLRWMMHAKPYTPDMAWISAIQSTTYVLCKLAPTTEVSGEVALQNLKTALVTRLLEETPRAERQKLVDEVCANSLPSLPRF
jgi:hypothetical protein